MFREITEAAHLFHSIHGLYESLEEMKEGLGERVKDIVTQHALAAAGVGLVPVPIVGTIGVVTSAWSMYYRITSEVGLPFEKNVIKSIAVAVGTNVVSVLPAMGVALVGAQVLKMIPWLGSVGGMAVDAASNYAIINVMGVVYGLTLIKLFKRGEPITAENLKKAASETASDKSLVKEIFDAAKKDFKEKHSDNKST